MGRQGVGGALLRAGTGFGQYCGAECKAAAEAAAGTAASSSQAAIAAGEAHDEQVKKEGLEQIMAINFDGDAKSIIAALGDLQTIAAANKSHDKESEKGIRKAAFQRIDLGIRMLRSAGDAGNAEYFEKQLKSMKKKAFLTNPVFIAIVGIVALCVFLAIYMRFI
jgi:hypothetical protein